MSEPAIRNGGGFCEKHGPYDPPHVTCPYCALEERYQFGPPTERGRTRKLPAGNAPELPGSDGVGEADRAADRASDHASDRAASDASLEQRSLEQNSPAQKMLDVAGKRAEPQATEQAPLPPELMELTETNDDEAPVQDVPLPPLGWLVVKEPVSMRGMVFAVAPGQVIGREGDVRWPDVRLSRQHARLTLEAADTVGDGAEGVAVFHLWPFAPKNPVYINGQAIRGATPLFENDEIRLGDTLLVFKVLMD